MIRVILVLIFLFIGQAIYPQESIQYTIGYGQGVRNDIFYVKSDPAGYLLGHPNKYHWREGIDKEKMYTFFLEARMENKIVVGLDFSRYHVNSFVAIFFHEGDISIHPTFEDYYSTGRGFYDIDHFQLSCGYAFDLWQKRLTIVPSIGFGYSLLRGGNDRPNATMISINLPDGSNAEPWYAKTFYEDIRGSNIYAHFNLQLNVPIYKGIIAFGKIHFIQGVFEEFQEIVSYEEPFRRIDGVDQFVGELSTRGSIYGWLAGIKLNLNWVFPKLNR